MISPTLKTIIKFTIGALIIIVGTLTLVAIARGFRFNILSWSFDKTGLVIINSQPDGAEITVNNKKTKFKTPYRLVNVTPGDISIKLTKEGYRDWFKKSSVLAEQVTFADYAWLLPDDLTTNESSKDLNPLALTTDKTGKKMAFFAAKPQMAIWVQDDLKQKPRNIYQPVNNPATPLTSIQPIAFNSDSSSILIRENNTIIGHYWSVPLTSSQPAININVTFGLNPDNQVKYSATNRAELFFTDKGSLRKINLDNKTASSIISDSVKSYTIGENRIFFVTATKTGNELWMADTNSLQKTKLADNLPPSTNYDLHYNRFNDKDYLGLLTRDNGDLYLYTDLHNNPKADLVTQDTSHFIFNKSGKYLVINDKKSLLSIDLEQNRRYNFQTPLEGLSSWAWIDDQHLAIITDKLLRLVDFDGQNDQQLIGNAHAASGIVIGPDKTIGVISRNLSSDSAITTIHLTKK